MEESKQETQHQEVNHIFMGIVNNFIETELLISKNKKDTKTIFSVFKCKCPHCKNVYLKEEHTMSTCITNIFRTLLYCPFCENYFIYGKQDKWGGYFECKNKELILKQIEKPKQNKKKRG